SFLGYARPVTLDLANTSAQTLTPDATGSVTLSSPSAFSKITGTPFADNITGGDASGTTTIIGAGCADYVAPGSGNTVLQANITQVVYLDFSALPPGAHDYTQAERDAIQQRLTNIYAAFDYFFTQDLAQAQHLAASARSCVKK